MKIHIIFLNLSKCFIFILGGVEQHERNTKGKSV